MTLLYDTTATVEDEVKANKIINEMLSKRLKEKGLW
jgi:hypothetical protein